MDETKSKPRPRKTAVKTAAKTAVKKVAPAKTVAARRPPKAAPSVPPDRDSLVRMAAYLRAERRGFAPGYEIEDWLAAEAEVNERRQATPAATPRKVASRKPRAGGGGTG
ncbi:MAG: hypothetical protein QG601_417 [Pseudomonadota bacterium]|nr:hypothetical protein [Pseudomonadota bacterium]MDQ1309149.1 hypothetical protein [Pseudomonadota bacterium]